MATYGKKLLDSAGNIILPKTRSSLVYMDDNSTVENKISSILSEITKIKDGTTLVGRALTIRDANLTDKKYQFYSTDQSSVTANTSIAILDETLKSSRPIDRAVNDVNAKPIHTTYMPKSGGNFTGTVSAKMDIVTGAAACLHNIHVPNLKTNVHYIILWT